MEPVGLSNITSMDREQSQPSKTDFHFEDVWRIDGSAEEVDAIFRNCHEIQRWWPACFLKVEILDEGDPDGVGGTVRALTKGLLPYSLQVMIKITAAQAHERYLLEFRGDLNGTTEAVVSKSDSGLQVLFYSQLRATKGIIRLAPRFLHRVFEWNHYWVMQRGEESLQTEINRVRSLQGKATTDGSSRAPAAARFPHNSKRFVNAIRWKRKVSRW